MSLRSVFMLQLLLSLSICTQVSVAAESGITTITNRTSKSVPLQISRDKALPQQKTLAAGQRIQLSTANRAIVQIHGGGAVLLAANMNYEIRSGRSGALLWHAEGKRAGRQPTPSKSPRSSSHRSGVGAISRGGSSTEPSRVAKQTATVPVKLLVDDEEPATQRLWEQRLRGRIDRASDILEAHCGVRLKVVAVERWDSDNRITDFARTLGEFEQEVDAGPARLAIGFSSQFRITKGRTNLGGTRGPLHSHILIREWSHAITEPERLEVLLHELGHYLGAPHCKANDSVMRPVLGDRKSRAVDFEIRFDETNTTIMNLVAEEIRKRRVSKLSDLSAVTRAELRKQYVSIANQYPKDPAARRFVHLLDRAASALPQR